MSLRAAYEQQKATKVAPCRVRSIVAELEGDDRDWLVEALESDSEPSAWIAAALTEAGLKVSDHTVGRHRDDLCSCKELR